MTKALLSWCVLVSFSLCSCSPKSDPAAQERVADKDVNTRHTKGTTDVLKNYRLPDVRPSKDPKQTLKGQDAKETTKPKPEEASK